MGVTNRSLTSSVHAHVPVVTMAASIAIIFVSLVALPADAHLVGLARRPAVSATRFVRAITPPSQAEVEKAVRTVQRTVNRNAQVKKELGQMDACIKVLGAGRQGSVLAVRFQGRFKRGGMGRVTVPLPFMLGQTTVPQGRGNGYASVAAKVEGSKVVSCFLEKDGGYGSRINVA